MMTMKFHEMTSPQLAAIDREQTLAVIPIAAVEQHGPHLPTGTDRIICTAVAEQLEASLPERVLLTPTIWLGASSHHLRFGATLDSQLPHFVNTLCDAVRSLLGDGYKRILLLNGHGGNIDPMRMALRQIQDELGFADHLLAAGCYWSVVDDYLRTALDGDHKFVGHACEFETSLILHLRPELVDLEQSRSAGPLVTDNIDGVFVCRDMRHRTAEGCTGRPDLATAEKGERLFAEIGTRLVTLATKLLNEPLAREYKEFI